MKPVREPAVAGRFYPGERSALLRDVRGFVGAADPAPAGERLVALIAPHAGYVYSGAVAGSAYGQLAPGGFRRVVVIGPSHRIPLRGSSIYERGAYRTPLGLIPIDEELAVGLLERAPGEVTVEPELHRLEHSLEVQLPFLQQTLGDFRLLPIVMGLQEEPHLSRLEEALVSLIEELPADDPALLVASTDLSHYYSDDEARRLDGVVLEDLEEFDGDRLYRHLACGKCEACGGGPMVVVLRAAARLGARRSKVLAYATSADASGDRSEVVGYVAAALYAERS